MAVAVKVGNQKSSHERHRALKRRRPGTGNSRLQAILESCQVEVDLLLLVQCRTESVANDKLQNARPGNMSGALQHSQRKKKKKLQNKPFIRADQSHQKAAMPSMRPIRRRASRPRARPHSEARELSSLDDSETLRTSRNGKTVESRARALLVTVCDGGRVQGQVRTVSCKSRWRRRGSREKQGKQSTAGSSGQECMSANTLSDFRVPWPDVNDKRQL